MTANTGATLEIENGGRVEAARISVATSPGTSGAIEVRGVEGSSGTRNPSTRKGTDVLSIGVGGGTGSLLIEDRGLVEAARVEIGHVAVNGGEKVTVAGMAVGFPLRRSTLSAEGQGTHFVRGDVGTQIEVKDGASLRSPTQLTSRSGKR
jgi:hypothetical protein